VLHDDASRIRQNSTGIAVQKAADFLAYTPCARYAFFSSPGIGAPGIDDHGPRGCLRKMRSGQDNRGRTESILGKETGNLRTFSQRNNE
jgi:hypothetical protein